MRVMKEIRRVSLVISILYWILNTAPAVGSYIYDHRGHYYFLTESAGTWGQTRMQCADAMGSGYGDLASMETEEEMDWLNANLHNLSLARDDEVWIGIHERTGEGDWTLMMDGSLVKTGGEDFTWAGGEKDDSGVMISKGVGSEWGFYRSDMNTYRWVLCESDDEHSYLPDTFHVGGRYFSFFPHNFAFITGRDNCRADNGWLAAVDDDEFLKVLGAKLNNLSITADMWIGVYRNDQFWTRSGNPVTFDSWDRESPTAGCTYLRYRYPARSLWRTDKTCGTENEAKLALCEVNEFVPEVPIEYNELTSKTPDIDVTTAPPEKTGDTEDGGLSDGEIAAIVVSCIAAVGISIGVIIYLFKRSNAVVDIEA